MDILYQTHMANTVLSFIVPLLSITVYWGFFWWEGNFHYFRESVILAKIIFTKNSIQPENHSYDTKHQEIQFCGAGLLVIVNGLL